MNPDRRHRYLSLTLLVAFIFVLWVQIPRLLDPYAVEDDFRNLHWVHQYDDSDLFPHAHYAQIGRLKDAAPGYALVLRLGAIFVPPIFLSKLLPFSLMLVAVYYIYRIVEQMADGKTAFVAGAGFAVFNLGASLEISVAAGLQRSFALPLLAAFVYFLMRRRDALAAALIFLSGLIYVPILPAMAIAYGLSSVRLLKKKGSWRLAIDWRRIAYLFVALFAVVVLLIPAFVWQGEQARSTAAGGANPVNVLRDPKYSRGGRARLFSLFPLVGRGGIVTLMPTAFQLGVLGFLALVVRFVGREPVRQLPPAFVNLLAGGGISFLLAWLAFLVTSSFLLYLPSRHTQYVIFLAMVVYVFANVPDALPDVALWLRRRRRQLAAVVAPVAAIAVLIVLFLPTWQAGYYQHVEWLPVGRWLLLGLVVALVILALQVARQPKDEATIPAGERSKGPGRLGWLLLGSGLLVLSLFYTRAMSPPPYVPSNDARQLFSYVETLPKDALLAGEPCTLDDVPLYAKRSVLFNCEGFGYLSPETIRDALSAYYAAEWEDVLAFCRRHDVSYFVVNAKSFTDQALEEGDYFFEPFNSQLHDTIRSRPRYVLAEIPADERLFQAGDLYVVSCRDEG